MMPRHSLFQSRPPSIVFYVNIVPSFKKVADHIPLTGFRGEHKWG